jgi:hypothetical protein
LLFLLKLNVLIMRYLYLIVFFSLFAGNVAIGQVSGDYRTVQTGNWDNAGIWERFNGTAWVAAVAAPASADGAIAIESGHVVTIPTGVIVSADQVTVNEDLVVASGGQLTLTDGTGTDLSLPLASSLLDVSGILLRGDLTSIDNQSTNTRIQFRTGSEYRHGYTTTFGDLPAAIWNANSTVLIQGFTNTTPLTADNTWDQTIGNLIYNAPGQRGLIDLAGNLSLILGDVSIVSTGTNVFQLSSVQSLSLTVGGNFTVNGSSRFNLSTSGNATFNITGNLSYNSTNTAGSNLTVDGTSIINLTGDFLMSAGAGRIHMAAAGTTGNATLNLLGNFLLTSGRLDEIGPDPTQGTVNFLGSGSRTFLNTGSIAGRINYNISAATILDVGTSPLSGASLSLFTLNGTIIVRSLAPLGAINTSTTSGNIRTPASGRTYASNSIVIYQGAGPQFMGSGQPQSAEVTTIINNASGITMASNVTINGSLQLQNGDLHLSNFRLTSGGTFSASAGQLRGNANSSLTIQGTNGGSWGALVFDPAAAQLGILTINRTGASAEVTLNNPLVIDSLLFLRNGTLNNISGLAFENDGDIIRYSSSELTGASPTAVAGTYHVTYRTTSPAAGPFANMDTGVELPTDPTSLGNLSITPARTGDFVNLTNDVTVNGDLILGNGTLRANTYTITMTGATWSDNSGIFNPGTGTVIFTGTTAVGGTSSTNFNNLQLESTSSVQFLRSFTITGHINFVSGSNFDMQNQTAIFSGSNSQAVSANGATFYNITISKAGGGVQLTSALNLVNLLQFTTSNINVQSNGFLTLVSTSDAAGGGTASIYRLQNGNSVTGDVTVQRYMSGEGKIYRYIGSPVSGSMVSQWKDDFDITGPFDDPSPRRRICEVATNPASYSLFYYDETAGGDIQQGYVGYPITGNATTNSPIVVGRGYAAYIRECVDPTIIDVTGPINFNAVTFPITYTVNTPAADGWNLVSNPFPCTIDWDQGSWTKTRVASVISITDNGTGMIRYYDAGISNEIPDGQIAIGQGFFVRATAANPILIIRETTKVMNTAEFFRERTPERLPSLALNFFNNQEHDKAYLKIQNGAKDGLDDYDAPKIANPLFSFSFVAADDRPMAINAIDEIPSSREFKLLMENVETGEYSIGLEIEKPYFSNYHFVLHDHYLDKSIPLKRSEVYSFNVSSDVRSSDRNRFSFSVMEGVEETGSAELQSLMVYPNPIQNDLTIDILKDDVIKLEFTTLQGKVQSDVDVNGQVGKLSVDFSQYAKGVYLMTIYKTNSKKTIRLFKE